MQGNPGQAGGESDRAGDAPSRRVCGINACRAVFEHRPDQIQRAWMTEAVARRHFGALMRFLADQRRGYQVVDEDELERLTESQHHEGICLQVSESQAPTLEALLAHLHRAKRACVVALEGVGNPHNLGAILRVAAHFGVKAVLAPDVKALQSGAAQRTAEGGAEVVPVVSSGELATLLPRLRLAGFRVLTTSSHKGSSLFKTPLPQKCVILFGEEARGLSKEAFAASDLCVRIPGTGAVESLNVSVATGILLGEYWRQHCPETEG